MKFLYKYPQTAYPYEELVRESQTRGRDVPEFEILDTDAFDNDRYWDVFVEVCISSFHLRYSVHPPLVRKRRGRCFERLRSHYRLQPRPRTRYVTHPSSVMVS
jgi:hypothetical protein